MSETIAAISTPAGSGAVGVVRLSGDKALEIALALTHRESLLPRYAHLCPIYDGDILVDEAIVLYFAAPKSYTREDVCEIQCHGGVILTRLILKLALKLGARLAKPGEFTKRAFLNGRIDISQAQAISQLIVSQNEEASKLLAAQMRGKITDFVTDSRTMLLRALAFSEVMIDYSDEDIPQDTLQDLLKQIDELCLRFKKILEFSLLRDTFIEGPSLCIIGKPNVGKSSLLNALLSEDRAIVSGIAGTTRDTIESHLNLDGQVVKIIDTAGMRASEDQIENIGIQKSMEAMKKSEIVLAVFDLSSELDGEDKEMIECIASHLSEKQKLILLLNKMDQESKFDSHALESRLNAQETLRISAHSLDSILRLKEILSQVVRDFSIPKGEVILSSDYQIHALKRSISALELSKIRLLSHELELFSFHIQEALDSLALLTQAYNIDEMFAHMFGEFCLGK